MLEVIFSETTKLSKIISLDGEPEEKAWSLARALKARYQELHPVKAGDIEVAEFAAGIHFDGDVCKFDDHAEKILMQILGPSIKRQDHRGMEAAVIIQYLTDNWTPSDRSNVFDADNRPYYNQGRIHPGVMQALRGQNLI